jgi:hypothetical protein
MIEPNTLSAQATNLRQEYESQKGLFESQTVIIQRFLELQGRQVAEALVNRTYAARFALPDRIVTQVKRINDTASISLPEKDREQVVGGLANRLTGRDVRQEIVHRLNELEQSPDQSIAVSAGLLRYAASAHMISNMLPDGRTVTYLAEGEEEIPTIPAGDETPESAITQASDAIAEEGAGEAGRGDLQVPFVPAARRFYLPQWVAFDGEGKLLVGTVEEAEAHVVSMQRYAAILHRAVSLTAYMVASEEYQRKRYGILGQLINQGRALARYRTQEIIGEIRSRAENQDLNRGLSITLPYFDDQNLEMDKLRFEVIPAGRIMFVPAFIVRASRGEQAKVAQDTRLNPSTRKHLLDQLRTLEAAFLVNSSKM